MRQIAALLAVLAVGASIAIAAPLIPGLKRVVRAVALFLVALLLLVALAIGVAGWSYDAFWALLIGGGLGLLALRFGWRIGRAGREERKSRAAWKHVPQTAVTAPDSPWNEFERRLDWVGRRQARGARQAIGSFLAERESPALTMEHRELLLRVERRVPELLEACLDRCRNALPDERDRYMDETLARLRQIGDEAEQARQEVRSADDRRLETLHRYFDGGAGGPDPRT